MMSGCLVVGIPGGFTSIAVLSSMSSMVAKPLGEYLHATRTAAGFTLRDVERLTGGQIKNGYLSQIENGIIQRPSPDVLYELSKVYGLDYSSLLRRAGHRVPKASVPSKRRHLDGLPLSALQGLDEEDQQALLEYVAFLKQRKKRSI